MTLEEAVSANLAMPLGSRRPWGEIADQFHVTQAKVFSVRRRLVPTTALDSDTDSQLQVLETQEGVMLTQAGRREWLDGVIRNGTRDQGLRAAALLEKIDGTSKTKVGPPIDLTDAELLSTLIQILQSAPPHILQEAINRVTSQTSMEAHQGLPSS